MFGVQKYVEEGKLLASLINPLVMSLSDEIVETIRRQDAKLPGILASTLKPENRELMKSSIAGWLTDNVVTLYNTQKWMNGRRAKAFTEGFVRDLVGSTHVEYWDLVDTAEVERVEYFDARTFSALSISVPFYRRLLIRLGVSEAAEGPSEQVFGLLCALTLCAAWMCTSEFFGAPQLTQLFDRQYRVYFAEINEPRNAT